MRTYTEIITETDLEALFTRVCDFHDSLAKEVQIMNRGSVQPDRSMASPSRLDARVLIQSQMEPFGIELLFIGVRSIEMLSPDEFFAVTGSIRVSDKLTERRTISLEFDGHFSISTDRLFFAERRDWLGPEARFGDEVPEPTCVRAIAVDPEWRQCSACAGAFEAPGQTEYVRCPSCGVLTELEIGST